MKALIFPLVSQDISYAHIMIKYLLYRVAIKKIHNLQIWDPGHTYRHDYN
jgi:hypothetical protein